jgi:hypothetical protein
MAPRALAQLPNGGFELVRLNACEDYFHTLASESFHPDEGEAAGSAGYDRDLARKVSPGTI